MGAEVFDRIANRLAEREGEIAVSHGILVVNLAPGAVLAAARKSARALLRAGNLA